MPYIPRFMEGDKVVPRCSECSKASVCGDVPRRHHMEECVITRFFKFENEPQVRVDCRIGSSRHKLGFMATCFRLNNV